MTDRTPSRRGFTLVELLVVIGIIGLLIGVLMPALSKARRASRSVACKAKLQQLGNGVAMYLNENRTKYPLSPSLPSVNPYHYPTIPQELGKHVSDIAETFHCPADDTLFATEGISYFYYAELGERPVSETLFFQVFGTSSQVPVLWDGDAFHGTAADYNWLFVDGHVEDKFVKPSGS